METPSLTWWYHWKSVALMGSLIYECVTSDSGYFMGNLYLLGGTTESVLRYTTYPTPLHSSCMFLGPSVREQSILSSKFQNSLTWWLAPDQGTMDSVMVNFRIKFTLHPSHRQCWTTSELPPKRGRTLSSKPIPLLSVNLNTCSPQLGYSQREKGEKRCYREPILLENSIDNSPHLVKGKVSQGAKGGWDATQKETTGGRRYLYPTTQSQDMMFPAFKG